ncbi:MAG: hypothetical protein AAB920_00945, partial [Patescibacteria group bacterium]
MKPIYKIIIISVSVLLAVFFVYFLWSKFFVPAPVAQEEQPNATINVPLPQDARIGAIASTSTEDSYTFRKLSNKPVLGFWVSKTTKAVF